MVYLLPRQPLALPDQGSLGQSAQLMLSAIRSASFYWRLRMPEHSLETSPDLMPKVRPTQTNTPKVCQEASLQTMTEETAMMIVILWMTVTLVPVAEGPVTRTR